MTTTTQTLIKIGDSSGVTLPAKELKRIGAKPGDQLRVSFELIETPKEDEIMRDYAAFKAQYGETLKNLADR
jgi:antitoxin component of MazEF toxin-antitoxin module